MFDSEGRELDRFRASLGEVQAWLRQHYPGLLVRLLPRRNPAVRIEWTGAGAGRYLAVVVDEHNQVIEEFLGTLSEVKTWMEKKWPQLPATFVLMMRNPRSREQPARKEGAISDRGHRYRANADPPPGPRICAWCGSTRNVEIAHVNGHEEDGSQANLGWVCRSCNVRCANTLRAAGIGRLTCQRNPAAKGAASLGQWLTAVLSMRGESGAMPVAQAVALIRGTSPADRSAFAHQIWRLRRARYGPTGRSGSVPF